MGGGGKLLFLLEYRFERGFCYKLKLAAPIRKSFFGTPFVARILTPRSRKPGYGLVLGCRSSLYRSESDK